MKIKLGPVEIEQDSLKDEVLYSEFKKSPKEVEKYLAEKSKFFDLTLKNTLAGKTMKMIRSFIFSIGGLVFFVGWSLYVFYISKDAFVWDEMNLQTAILAILQSLLIIGICFLPLILVAGYVKIVNTINSKKEQKVKK